MTSTTKNTKKADSRLELVKLRALRELRGKIAFLKIARKSIPGAFVIWVVLSIPIHLMAAETLLTPPGLRPVKDPALVIPAGYQYPNQPIDLPVYRDRSGNPASGWSRKFIHTRRFSSDQSAWIFFRNSDLNRSVVAGKNKIRHRFRFWPVGTAIVIESHKGDATRNENEQLVEIAVMSKVDTDNHTSGQVFYPVNWAYARFSPDGKPSFTSAKVHQCHQCHGIAFHLTGDLVFTPFP
jgi:Cytochrome P460